MKFRYLLIITILIIATRVSAQENSSGKIYGKIIDSSTKEGLQSASVVVLNSKDSTVVTGSKTDKNGKFAITDIPFGKYFLKASYIGYNSLSNEEFSLNIKNPQYNSKEIALKSSSTNLDAIKVTADKSIIEYSGGKKVINIEKSMINTGGNALDVMKTLPSVDVDLDGNVALRGTSSVKILIDGKPTSLMGSTTAALEQLPAGSIESVELITNPSAKYEAEGLAGIINIVLKKDRANGLNGQISLNAGTKDKYSSSISMNYNMGIFNFFGSYDYKSDIRTMNSTIFRSTIYQSFINQDSLNYLDQIINRRRMGKNHNMRAGFDLNLNKQNRFTIAGTYRDGKSGSNESSLYSALNNNRVLYDYQIGNNTEDDPSSNYDLNFNYTKLFSTKDQKLTVDAVYSNMLSDETQGLDKQFYTTDKITLLDTVYKQLSTTKSNYTNFNIQTDYENKFEDGSKIEAGLKSNKRKTDDDYILDKYSAISKTWYNETASSNHFVYDEFINAAYTTYSMNFGDFGVMAGLRAENTNTKSTQLTSNKNFDIQYFDFFPSLNFNYKFPEMLDIQLNYSRRINRPNVHQINPFIDYGDPLNLHYGNPNLDPEYINSYEMGFIKNFQPVTLNATVFYRQTDNAITRYAQLDSGNVMAITYYNLASNKSYGFEFGFIGEMASWWRLNADFSYYMMKVEGSKLMNSEKREDTQWNTKFTSSFNILDNLGVQVMGNYSSPNITVQGSRESFYSIDFGGKLDLLNNKLSVTLRWSDIFDSMKYKVLAAGTGFGVERLFKRETSVITLGIIYRINDGLKQRDKKRNQEEGNGESFDM